MTYAINPTVAFAATKDEQLAAIAFLPALSLVVYEAVLKGLYAEPHFSDLDAEQVAAMTGRSIGAVAGALGYLTEAGLVEVERAHVNKRSFRLIHAAAHDEGWKEEAFAAIATRKAEGPAKRKRPSRAGKTPKAKKALKQLAIDPMGNLQQWKIRLESGEWHMRRAASATEAREKAVRDGFKVKGRAYAA